MRILSILLLLFTLNACFLVKDFGEYWYKGETDPKLAGKWVSTKDDEKTVEFILDGTQYRYADEKDPTRLKTINIGDHNFLMVKNDNNDEKLIVKYAVTNDNFILYQFNESLFEVSQSSLGDSGSVLTSGKIKSFQIDSLDKQSIASILELSELTEYWNILIEFDRVKDDSTQ